MLGIAGHSKESSIMAMHVQRHDSSDEEPVSESAIGQEFPRLAMTQRRAAQDRGEPCCQEVTSHTFIAEQP